MDSDVRYLEIAYSMQQEQLKLLKSYAASPDMTQAIYMCRLYYPNFSGAEAEKFMTWLKTQRRL